MFKEKRKVEAADSPAASKSPKKKRILCIAGIAVLVILILILLLRGCQPDPSPMPPTEPPISNDLPTNGGLSNEEPDPVEPSYFNIKINATPTLSNEKLNLRVENSEKNLYPCQFDISLQRYKSISSTGEKLYLKKDGNNYAVSIQPDVQSYRLSSLDDPAGYQEVTLEDDTKTIYRSPRIEPGQSLETCTLKEQLPNGYYYATVHYTILDPVTEKVVGQSNVNINIKVS